MAGAADIEVHTAKSKLRSIPFLIKHLSTVPVFVKQSRSPPPVLSPDKLYTCSASAEAKAEVLEPPVLARVPLPSGALPAVAAKLKQYTAVKQQHLLAVAGKGITATAEATTDEVLKLQWQVGLREHL